MVEVNLPKGWAVTTIGAVARVSSGVGFPIKYQGKSEGLYPVYKVGDVSKAVTSKHGNLAVAGHYVDKEEAAELKGEIFPVGATLFAKIGEAVKLNRRAFVRKPGLADNNVMAVIPDKSDCNRFLYQFLRAIDLTETSRSTTVPSIRKGDIEDIELYLPPLAEQIVIADKLDTLLAQVETTKARLERIPEILKSFRQSVLSAAVSGKLTQEWRESHGNGTGEEVVKADAINKSVLLNENPALKKKKSTIESQIDTEYIFDLPESWGFTTWGKISEWITYGFTKPMPKSDSGVKLLTAKDVQYFDVNINDAGLTTSSAFQSLSDKDRPIKGDLLITKDGSIGRAALVRTDEPFCINQSVAVCWLRSTSMNKDYLEFLANSEFTQRFVKDKAQGMAIQHLSIIDYAKCPLPVPSLEEQTEIVRRVEELFAFADSIEQKATAALARVNNLTQSILAKAFRGELTADWRAANPELISGDNSAAALLEKIKVEREVMKKQPKPKRSNIKKKTGSHMSKQIIKVVDALKEAGEPLSGQQLLAAAGYPSDSCTEQLEQFFLDIRKALISEKSIVKLQRGDDGQDWFALAQKSAKG